MADSGSRGIAEVFDGRDALTDAAAIGEARGGPDDETLGARGEQVAKLEKVIFGGDGSPYGPRCAPGGGADDGEAGRCLGEGDVLDLHRDEPDLWVGKERAFGTDTQVESGVLACPSSLDGGGVTGSAWTWGLPCEGSQSVGVNGCGLQL